MKRSEINALIRNATAFLKQHQFFLPPFAYWSAQDWQNKGTEYDEIRDNMLGWDITDFGSGDFAHIGLLLFTIRNGSFHNASYTKPYAEKLLIAQENQVTPYHFHWSKMEDIINRGGGNLVVKMYSQTDDERLSDADVPVCVDGHHYTVKAGTEILLTPGESITIYPGQYHSFWGQLGTGTVLIGEVSKVNDDTADNRFLEKTGRFPAIEEDVAPAYLLYTDYLKK